MERTEGEYTCKHCKIKMRKKAVTELMFDLRTCPQCYTKRIIMRTEGTQNLHSRECDILNASKDMTTEQAVAYLEHGKEMEEEIKSLLAWLEPQVRGQKISQVIEVDWADITRLKKLLTKLEVNDD